MSRRLAASTLVLIVSLALMGATKRRDDYKPHAEHHPTRAAHATHAAHAAPAPVAKRPRSALAAFDAKGDSFEAETALAGLIDPGGAQKHGAGGHGADPLAPPHGHRR